MPPATLVRSALPFILPIMMFCLGPHAFCHTPMISTGTASGFLPWKTVHAVAIMPGFSWSSGKNSTGPAFGGVASAPCTPLAGELLAAASVRAPANNNNEARLSILLLGLRVGSRRPENDQVLFTGYTYRRYYPPLSHHRLIEGIEIARKKRVRNPRMALDVRPSRFGPAPSFTGRPNLRRPASSARQLVSMIGLLRDSRHGFRKPQWRLSRSRPIDSPMRKLGASARTEMAPS